MRLLIALVWLAGACGDVAIAEDVPLPRPRPSIWVAPQTFQEAAGSDFNSTEVTSAPTECDERLGKVAVIEPMPRLIGPDACGGGDMVQLNAVLLAGDERITLKPPPILRCHFAESLASWLHDEAAPRAEKLGAPLRAVETYDDSSAAAATASPVPNSASTARAMPPICAHLCCRRPCHRPDGRDSGEGISRRFT